ncbi:MAG: hypothetical protein ABR915_18160, partial [Thermoguttaceae bacterium]
RKTDGGTTVFLYRFEQFDRPASLMFKEKIVAKEDQPIQAVLVGCRGGKQKVAVPAVRVYGPARWARPQEVEIEWAFQDDKAAAVNGRIEAHFGRVGAIEPLAAGNGVTVLGEHQWREQVPASGRRGIRTTLFPIAGSTQHRTIITLWTSTGVVSFTVDDLERGPILVPSVGVFIAPAESKLSARQFQDKLAAGNKKTVRQRVREHPEQTYAGAMAGVFGDSVAELPPFPEPPYEPAMKIDVPEKALVSQWRLGAWHLKRWSKKIDDATYAVSIWPFRTPGDRPTCIAMESGQIIRTLDLIGVHDVAVGGVNYWLFAKQRGEGGNRGGGYGNYFTDFDGVLLTDDYDMRHAGGHGQLLQAAAMHYRITGDKAWAQKAAPQLKKACEWIVRQRKTWDPKIPKGSWCYGLQPPSSVGDGYGTENWYCLNAEFHAGLKMAAGVLVECGVDGADELLREAERYRQDIRAAAERSLALSPVVPVRDGTYRRFVPAFPYARRSKLAWHREAIAGAIWLVTPGGIYDAHEALAQELLDVFEDTLQSGETEEPGWLDRGGYGAQIGHEKYKTVHLLSDDVPPFLRALYNGYAVDIRPWSDKSADWPEGANYKFHDGHLVKGTIKGLQPNYAFSEHPQFGSLDKTHEEAAFLEQLRNMLVMEIGDSLWIARATPRVWLEQGKKISVKNAPTHFGTVAYEIVSDVDNGKINATVELPLRKASKEVVLRFRHPKSATIKSVTVNGKPWSEFNKDKETIALKGLSGTAAVTAQY